MSIQSTGYNTTTTNRAGMGSGPVLASSTLNGENVRNASGEDHPPHQQLLPLRLEARS